MVSNAGFKCGANNDNCLSGSVCNLAGTGCICPEGFRDDTVLFHHPNCDRPSNTYMNLFLCSIIFGLPIVFYQLMLLSNTKRRDMKTLAFWSSLGNIAMIFKFWFTWIQDGHFELAIVAWNLAMVFNGIAAFLFISAFLQPVGIPNQTFPKARRSHKLFFGGMCVVWLIFGAVQMAQCRSNHQTYNTMIGLWFLSFGVANGYLQVIVLQHSKDIQEAIPDTLLEKKLTLNKRVAMAEKFLILNIVANFVPNMIAPLQNWIQGSIAYFWIVVAVIFIGLFNTIHLIVALFIRWDGLHNPHSMVSESALAAYNEPKI